jgi:hypothetical protein
LFFFTRGVVTSTTLTLKLIIQELLRSYTKEISLFLTKTKALLMVSTCEITFNIDGLTINLMLNIPIQKFLFNFLNVSSHSLNWLTCQYEQFQLVIMDEISLIGAKIFNVINNRLMFIKHIKNYLFACLDVIITCDFY